MFAQATTTPGRPWHLWLIGIIGVLWCSMGVLSFMLTQMNVEAVMSRFPPQQRAYFESFPLWVVAFWAIGVFGGVIGCVLLLLENRLAFRVLLASLIGVLVYNLGGLYLLGGMAVMRETGGLGFTVIPIVFAAFLAYYARVMSKKGVGHAVLAAIFLMLPSPAPAQEVGIKAGANFASLTPAEDENPDTSRLLGAVGGVWVRIAPATRVSLQIEGLFSEKGVRFEPNDFGLDNPADIRVRYIEIPVLARAGFGASGSAARAFVVGGVAPAFKLSAHTKTVFAGQERTRDIDDEIYSVDLGLVGGLGVEFGRALVEARYTHGLRHINTDDNGDEDRIKNRVFSLLVGFRLR